MGGHASRRAAAALVAVTVLAASCRLTSAVTAQPVADGVTVVTLDLVDTSRPTAAAPGVPAAASRSLPTTVHVPQGTGAAPLIVLAHGAAGAPEKFTELASSWAARGYVVAAPRFPLTNDAVPEPVIGDLSEQARDVRFVIDGVLTASAGAGRLAGRVDPARIGLFGLSLGALTVWTTVTEDSTGIDALIQSDGATLVPDDRLAGIEFPVFVAHSDIDPIFPYDDVRARYDALPGPKYLLTLHGAPHAAVAENTDTPADEVYQQATTAFWDRALGGRAEAPFPPPLDGITSFVEGAGLPGTR